MTTVLARLAAKRDQRIYGEVLLIVMLLLFFFSSKVSLFIRLVCLSYFWVRLNLGPDEKRLGFYF